MEEEIAVHIKNALKVVQCYLTWGSVRWSCIVSVVPAVDSDQCAIT